MADLATWAMLGEAVGGLAVLGGVGFGLYELRRARYARDEAAARIALQRIREGDALRAIRAVLQLAPDTPARDIEADDDVAQAVSEVTTALTEMGMQLYQGALTWKVIAEGNPWLIYRIWQRTHRWVKGTRQAVGPSNVWGFEWLVAQFQAQGLVPAGPAADSRPFKPGDGMAASHG